MISDCTVVKHSGSPKKQFQLQIKQKITVEENRLANQGFTQAMMHSNILMPLNSTYILIAVMLLMKANNHKIRIQQLSVFFFFQKIASFFALFINLGSLSVYVELGELSLYRKSQLLALFMFHIITLACIMHPPPSFVCSHCRWLTIPALLTAIALLKTFSLVLILVSDPLTIARYRKLMH